MARTEGSLTFADPEGLGLELVVVETADDPLIAESPEIPSELALQGFHGVRATRRSPRSRSFLEDALGFESRGDTAFEARGEQRGSLYEYDATDDPAIPGAGTVHHVAWSSPIEEHEAWRQRAGGRRDSDAGHRPLLLQVDLLPRAERRAVRDRDHGPGFTADEPLETLGERLSLPPNYEQLRDQVEPALTPLPNPREAWAAKS